MKSGNTTKTVSRSSNAGVSAAVNALPPPVEKDSPPMTEQDLAKARRVPRVTTLRRALRMTQEQFSAEFKIPIGTLRDWEQGRVEPDATARAYLRAIAGNAEAVAKALMTYRLPATE